MADAEDLREMVSLAGVSIRSTPASSKLSVRTLALIEQATGRNGSSKRRLKGATHSSKMRSALGGKLGSAVFRISSRSRALARPPNVSLSSSGHSGKHEATRDFGSLSTTADAFAIERDFVDPHVEFGGRRTRLIQPPADEHRFESGRILLACPVRRGPSPSCGATDARRRPSRSASRRCRPCEATRRKPSCRPAPDRRDLRREWSSRRSGRGRCRRRSDSRCPSYCPPKRISASVPLPTAADDAPVRPHRAQSACCRSTRTCGPSTCCCGGEDARRVEEREAVVLRVKVRGTHAARGARRIDGGRGALHAPARRVERGLFEVFAEIEPGSSNGSRRRTRRDPWRSRRAALLPPLRLPPEPEAAAPPFPAAAAGRLCRRCRPCRCSRCRRFRAVPLVPAPELAFRRDPAASVPPAPPPPLSRTAALRCRRSTSRRSRSHRSPSRRPLLSPPQESNPAAPSFASD